MSMFNKSNKIGEKEYSVVAQHFVIIRLFWSTEVDGKSAPPFSVLWKFAYT